jgi:hypothetical protein
MECDAKDRHVLAAAVHAHADTLVTFNTKDFPSYSMAPYPVALTAPENFLLDLLDLAPRLVLGSLTDQTAGHKREPKTLAGLLLSSPAVAYPPSPTRCGAWSTDKHQRDGEGWNGQVGRDDRPGTYIRSDHRQRPAQLAQRRPDVSVDSWETASTTRCHQQSHVRAP